MHTFLADIRFGVRMLLKSPLMTFIALLALTLGIGANTAIFSVVNAVLLRTFPYTDAESLVLVWEKRQGARTDQNVINLGNFSDWKDQNQVFSDMAVFFDRNFNLTSDGEPEEVVGQFGTTNLFSVLGTNAALGRTFVAEDGREGQPRVMPANFGWHIQRGTQASKPADIWVPLQISNELRRRRGRFASAVARLKPGVSRDQAQREFDTIGARLAQQYPEFNTNWGVNVVPLRTQVRSLFVVTQVALALVLLVGAGLLLKSFNRLQSVDPGFNPGNLLTMRVSLPLAKYETEQKRIDFFKQAIDRMKEIPGVESVGAIYMKEENVPTEIIGVVGDHKHLGLDVTVEPVAYWPHPELVYPGMTLMLRTRGEAGTVAPAARNVIRSLDPQQPIGEVSTMASLLSTSVARARFSASLLTVFSFVALVMAAVGIYGVMSYSVLSIR